MTLTEAIVSLPWQEVEARRILIDCISSIMSLLGSILLILLTVIILIEAAKYAGNSSGRFLEPKWHKYRLALPADHNMTPFLTKLGYLFGGTIIILLSYGLAVLELNLLVIDKGTYPPPLINDTGVAVAIIRHYLTYSGATSVLLNCLAGLAVMISAVGGRWFRNLANLLFTLALAHALFAGFFYRVVGESL